MMRFDKRDRTASLLPGALGKQIVSPSELETVTTRKGSAVFNCRQSGSATVFSETGTFATLPRNINGRSSTQFPAQDGQKKTHNQSIPSSRVKDGLEFRLVRAESKSKQTTARTMMVDQTPVALLSQNT